MAKNESSYNSRVSTHKFDTFKLTVDNLRQRVFRNENDLAREFAKIDMQMKALKKFLDTLLYTLMKHTDIDEELTGLLNALLFK